jgi:UDP-N-acetylglucosamine--N-acetylmuramyl-(pentapeptide) pyrophosphoryl-undecaprenol N-acetylglucosamine transferase
VALLPHLAQIEAWQILHLTGAADFESVRTAYGNGMAAGKVVAYTDDMADALAAADLVISRSGASTLAELTAVGRASVLMPYPHHRDQHQLANARCLARSGAARIVADSVDTGQNASSLRAALDELLRDDGARERMAAAARRIGQGNAASRISAIIFARFLTPLARTIETVEPSL